MAKKSQKTPHSIQNVVEAFFSTAWAIRPEKYEAIRAAIEIRAEGQMLSAEEIEAAIGADDKRQELSSRVGKIAILPLYGVMSQRINLLTAISGGTSTEMIGAELDALVADPNIAGIVLDVDSPGGEVFGTQELADKMFAAREQKPIIAVANAEMASGAYYVGSQANEIYVTPSGQVGSIGVIAAHTDYSKQDAMAGMKTTLITAGRYKAALHPDKPLDDDGMGYAQKRVNEYYEMFLAAVARGRETDIDDVRENYGQGMMIGADEAVEIGMADGVGTLDDAIEMLTEQAAAHGGARMITQENRDMAKNRQEAPLTAADLPDELIQQIEGAAVKTAMAESDAEHKQALASAVETAKTEATTTERDRCTGIVQAAIDCDLQDTANATVLQIVKDGSEPTQALLALKDEKIKQLEKNSPENPGPNGPENPKGDAQQGNPKQAGDPTGKERLEKAKAYAAEHGCTVAQALSTLAKQEKK